MVVIRMSGGIGNQMFQYALYLRLVSMGRAVKLDDVTEYALSGARPVMLSVFGIDYPRAEREDVIRLTDGSMRLSDRVRRKLTGRKSREYHERSTDYDPEVLEKEEAYLCGCFQSERYFEDILEKVREAFRFRSVNVPEEIREQVEEYERQMRESCSVSIHIRRGDYLNAQDKYGGICTDAYYNRAIACMEEWFPQARFFVFTNDTFWAEKWCEAKEDGERFSVVKGTDEDTGYIDLMLMSGCRHHIIANSSFSWWGAFLGESAKKRVIAPDRWLNTEECHDIYTSGMTRIDAHGRVRETIE